MSFSQTIHYWNYYDEDYQWNDRTQAFYPDWDLTRSTLIDAGMPQGLAQRCVESGYVFEPTSKNIIDRYYGGLLFPSDQKTRFRVDQFVALDHTPRSRVQVCRANSWKEVRKIVDDIVSARQRRVLFRGQTCNYALSRSVPNPFFVENQMGEISLLPSLWRKMLAKTPLGMAWYSGLESYEWRKIVDHTFDVHEIERRMQSIAGNQIAYYNLFDFEECDDPLVSEYAKCRLDIQMEKNNNLLSLLATLLQHYGLYSPVLDLTDSLEVAIFFATHKFERTKNLCTYRFVGTNARKAVIYLFREDKREMQAYESDHRVLRRLKPLRPLRQNCVVSNTSPFAMNLPADFLESVIILDFDSFEPETSLTTEILFPSREEDVLLDALYSLEYAAQHVSNFKAECIN